jgi:hypothetical protein
MTSQTSGGAYWRLHDLACSLNAGATGLTYAQAGVELLIEHDCWLRRADFTEQFITTGSTIAPRLAFIDWPAAIAALQAGNLPCSGGERRMLSIAASIAAGTPVDLSDALPGLDTINLALVATAVLHAGGYPYEIVDPPAVHPRHLHEGPVR